MNRFEARARQIALRVPPEALAGHPDDAPTLWLVTWRRFQRWILPLLVLIFGLYLMGFQLVRPETIRLAAIAQDILGDAKTFDNRAARLRIKERLSMITALETLLVPGAEPGLWPTVARLLGFNEAAILSEDRRFALLTAFISQISEQPEDRRRDILRLAILAAQPKVDLVRLDTVRVIAELPTDLRDAILGMQPGALREMFVHLRQLPASALQSHQLENRVKRLAAELDSANSELLREQAELDRKLSDADKALRLVRRKKLPN